MPRGLIGQSMEIKLNKMDYKELEKVFEDIFYMPNDKTSLEINGIVYKRHELFGVFVKLLKKYRRENGDLQLFRDKVLSKYELKEKEGTISLGQEEFINDVIGIYTGYCHPQDHWDYPDDD